MTKLTTEELRDLLEKATPGPWGIVSAQNVWIKAGPLHVATIPRAIDGDWSPSNTFLIAAAPDLAAEVLALRAEVEKLKGALLDIFDGEPEWPDQPEMELSWCRNRARAALSEGGE